MEQAFQILGTVIPLFVVIAVGAVLRKRLLLNEAADRTLLDLNVHLLLPCLILDNVAASQALRESGNLLWSPSLGFIGTAACFGIAVLIARLARLGPPARARTFGYTAGIYNYGYIPVPLVTVLYGTKALGVLFLFNLGTEIAFWTVGMSVLEGRSVFGDWRKALTTPVRAIILAVTVNLVTEAFGLRLDPATLSAAAWGWPIQVVLTSIHLLGLVSIPLALLLIGATMADFWGKFHTKQGAGVMGLAILVRNFLCPLGFIFAACILPVSVDLKETLVVQAAMPAGILSLVLARRHGGDVPVALQVIYATSAAALITLPLWIHLGMRWIAYR